MTSARNRSDGYVDLRDYAAIGDGRTIALIAWDGRIDWLPLPNLDSPPVFGALLDAENGGYIELAPVEPFSAERAYVAGSNVLVTTFTTATGRVRVTDSMNTGVAGRLPWAELGRRIDGVEGHVQLTATVLPGTCLNTASPWIRQTPKGESLIRVDGLSLAVRQLGGELDAGERSVAVRYRTSPGSRHLLGVVATDREPLHLPDPGYIDDGIDRTIESWSTWLENFRWDGDWAAQVERSALALKLLTFAPTGAIVAAATTSLPESSDHPKNWDYRYAWVRDMAYALESLSRFGLREEVHAATSWLLATIRKHGPHPRIFYTVHGELPDGRTNERDVPGWRGHGPVLSGNTAINQLQPGVFGDLFSLLRQYVEQGNVLDEWTAHTLTVAADTACDTWRSKDSGMWELETERHYTTSKMGCWKALVDAARLAELGEIGGNVERWKSEAALIREWIENNCWSEERGSYVWYPGTDQLDASVVLHAISGYERGERMRRTLDAIRRELGSGPYLYRYSGAEAEERCFLACSFWFVSALALVGRTEDARMLMDDLMSAPNDVGMMSEMIEPDSGAFWGNLPQTLSHLALMNAAITLSSASD